MNATPESVCPSCKSTDVQMKFTEGNAEVYWLECQDCLDTTPSCGHPVDATSAWPVATPTPTDEEVKP